MFGKKDESAVPANVPGRNDPCHCGSGKKYKKCHEDKDAAATHTQLEKKWAEAEKVAAKQAQEEQAAAAKAGPTAPSHKPVQQNQPHTQKHNTIAAPKFNMPRKTGGG